MYACEIMMLARKGQMKTVSCNVGESGVRVE